MAEQSPAERARSAALYDFQSAMQAGMGSTRGSDERGQRFDQYLKSGEFRKSGLDEVASTLMANIRGFLSFSELPIIVFNYGRRFDEVVRIICKRNGLDLGPIPFTGAGIGAGPSERSAQMIIDEGILRWLCGRDDFASLIGLIVRFDHVAGVASIYHDDRSQQTYAGFYSSLVIQSWTIFESVCEDLWEDALNSHPRTLATLAGKFRSKFGRKSKSEFFADSSGEDEQDRSTQFSLNDLQRQSFDLRKVMGTALKRRFSFKSLEAIRSAYYQAFSKNHANVDAVLDDDGLQYAAAVRNLLIHKGGIVDQEFLRQTAKIPDVPKVNVGDAFQLTGKLSAYLADSCRCCAVWLVMEVHDWIIRHPPKEIEDDK